MARLSRKARRVVLAAGAGLVILAFAVDWISGRPLDFGMLQVLLAAAGFLLVVGSLAGERFIRAYKAAAIVVLNVIVLFAILEFGASLSVGRSGAENQGKIYDELDYYRAQPWSDEFLAEHLEVVKGLVYSPYVGTKAPPYSGRYINIDEESSRVVPDSEPPATGDGDIVMVFGGSAVWGYGVPDFGTVPAYLQTRLREKNPRVRVFNCGQNGFISTQSFIELVRRLQSGVIPKRVVFYSGPNDIHAAAQTGAAATPFGTDRIAARLEGGLRPGLEFARSLALYRLAADLRGEVGGVQWSKEGELAGSREDLADDIVATYLTNVRMIRALAREFGFEASFFWQPIIVSSRKKLTDEEKRLRARYKGQAALVRTVYGRMRREAEKAPDLFFLGNVLDDRTDSLYIDPIHLNPIGNQVVAEAIAAALEG